MAKIDKEQTQEILTEVRVLSKIHSLDADTNTVITLTQEQLEVFADQIDASPEAVAYAKSIVVTAPEAEIVLE